MQKDMEEINHIPEAGKKVNNGETKMQDKEVIERLEKIEKAVKEGSWDFIEVTFTALFIRLLFFALSIS